MTASSSSRRRLLGPTRRVDGKGEAEHRDRLCGGGSAAGYAGAERAPADDQRQLLELGAAQVLDHRGPGRIELARRSGRAPARHEVGLLDERDAHGLGLGDLRDRDQIARLDAATRAVAEHERGRRRVREMQVRPRGAVRRVDLDRGAHVSASSKAFNVLRSRLSPDRTIRPRAGRSSRIPPCGRSSIA